MTRGWLQITRKEFLHVMQAKQLRLLSHNTVGTGYVVEYFGLNGVESHKVERLGKGPHICYKRDWAVK